MYRKLLLQPQVLAQVRSTRQLRFGILLIVVPVLDLILWTRCSLHASNLQRRLDVVDGRVDHLQVLVIGSLRLATLYVAIVSLGALNLLI